MGDLNFLLAKANKLFAANHLEEAAELYLEAIKIQPENSAVLNNLGNIYLAKGDYNKAAYFSKLSLDIDPLSVAANSNLGFISIQTGQFLKAAEHFFAALKKEPAQAYLWNDLGNALFNLNETSEASNCYKKAIGINPKYTESYISLGEIAAKQENSSEAVNYLTKALAIDESNAKAHYELSRVYYLQTGDFSKAIHHAQKALTLKPDYDEAKITLAELLLLKGNLTEGFPMFDQSRHLYIDKSTGRYKFFQMIPRWQGEPFPEKRLIIGEDGGFGGYGDILLFARYLPMVKERGGYCLLPVKKELFRLFKSLEGVDELLLPSDEPIYPKDFDLHIPFVSLPVIFGTSLETIPANIPYLSPDEKLTLNWQQIIKTTAGYSENSLKVGLVWSCGLLSVKHRSCDFKFLAPLGNVANVTYYNLQVGKAAKEYLSADFNLSMVDLTEHITDFADTAALINNLDLVISVDTAVAHLAGAIGKPVWLILPFMFDWKWFEDRTDSPWYPTMRIFRSKAEGDWDGVISEVCACLKTAVKGRRG